jgi:hypothetical protein
MIRRILLALMLLATTLRAEAGFFTDIWYKAIESGWGVNLVQTDDFIFVTFFIYGPDGAPIWYHAELRWDGVSSFTGGVYATRGTFFGIPWNPAALSGPQVGTASFTPSAANAYEGTIAYTVTGVGSASHLVERQSLTLIALGGAYVGGQAGGYSGCTNSANDGAYKDYYDLAVTHLSNGAATFQFDYTSGLSCTLSGTLVQNGQLYRIPTATYTCSDGLDTTATMSEIKSTSQGLEGRFFAANVGDGCNEGASFSGTLR